MVFHGKMWEQDLKEDWVPKNSCFWTMVLENIHERPLVSKEIKLVSPKRNQSWLFIGRTDAESEVPTLWSPDAKSQLIEKDLNAWENLKAGGKGGDRGWDDWMASQTQWTCVWAYCRILWNSRKPGMLQSMGSHRIWHNLATEQQHCFTVLY